MEKIVIKGTKEEIIESMEEMGYHMEGFNDASIESGHFYAYKTDYQGADYYTISKSDLVYTITQC